MIKKIIMIGCICLCFGCSRNGSMKHDDLQLESAFENIQNKIEENGWRIGTLNEEPITDEQLLQDYGINAKDVEAYMVKQAVISATCGEIAIFHLKDENSSMLEEAVKQRIASLKLEMQLLPKQRASLEQYQIQQIGRYYVFVLGLDAQSVIQYISSL